MSHAKRIDRTINWHEVKDFTCVMGLCRFIRGFDRKSRSVAESLLEQFWRVTADEKTEEYTRI